MASIVSVVIGVVAALCMVSGHLSYIWQVATGRSKPNAASWSIWAFQSTVSALSYKAMSSDNILSLWLFACGLSTMGTFLFSLIRGKFTRIGKTEWGLLVICATAIILLKGYRDATGASLLSSLALGLSFVPTIVKVRLNPQNEKPLPWWFWNTTYSLAVTNVVLRWDNQPANLATPIVGLLANLWVTKLAYARREKV